MVCQRAVGPVHTILSQFMEQKQPVSPHLISILSRGSGWSEFSYISASHTVKLPLQSTMLINTHTQKKEKKKSSAFPCPSTLPSEEQGTWTVLAPETPLNPSTPCSFFPVERASPGGSHLQIQLLDREETHFPSSFPCFSQDEEHTYSKTFLLYHAFYEQARRGCMSIYTHVI